MYEKNVIISSLYLGKFTVDFIYEACQWWIIHGYGAHQPQFPFFLIPNFRVVYIAFICHL